MNTNQQKALYEYLLWMGDTTLVLGHRISEWCGHGPILEEDIALTNIALDLLGQARFYLTYAGEVEGKGRSEDDLAYLRDVMDYKNSLLVEQPNGDFAYTMIRQLLFTALSYHLQEALLSSSDERIRGIAEKAIKEVTYHLRHVSDWVIRLGDGTEESHNKAQEALDEVWMLVDDLFVMLPGDKLLVEEKITPDLADIRKKWNDTIKGVLEEATLKVPSETYMMKGGREGKHSEHLGFILAELQFLPRAYPDAKW
ncbi:MAG TPA: 1,2-phenylacetyl-CoA epoxidase subunit PaaC [Bacteroidia bacterium]|jgi:ring-1,2-phenylacetyl-CoA epoxidase subunit PaaC|nr:1,2-phenylacetyl-CoA epoxidase subunit PaaC [Bacteroidia bacterium]